MLVALALFTLILFFVTDHRRLRRYTFTSLVAGVVLYCCPSAAGDRNQHQRRPVVDPAGAVVVPALELAKIALTIFFAGYLVRKREALATVRRRILGLGIPRARFRRCWWPGWSPWCAAFQRDLHGADVLRRLRDSAVRVDAAPQLADHRWGLFALAAVLGYLAFDTSSSGC